MGAGNAPSHRSHRKDGLFDGISVCAGQRFIKDSMQAEMWRIAPIAPFPHAVKPIKTGPFPNADALEVDVGVRAVLVAVVLAHVGEPIGYLVGERLVVRGDDERLASRLELLQEAEQPIARLGIESG